jgi:hypothetical protein
MAAERSVWVVAPCVHACSIWWDDMQASCSGGRSSLLVWTYAGVH